ncbi:MAG TPA: sensor histidine kinase [Amnibacterium sp.]|jgi:signal transduction histidine kinase
MGDARMRRSAAVGIAIAALAAALQVANCAVNVPLLSSHYPGQGVGQGADLLAVLLALVGGACLAFGRRAAVPVLIVSAASACAYLALGYPPARPLAPAVALLTVAATSSTIVTAVAGTALVLGVSIAVLIPLGWLGEDLDDRLLDNVLLFSLACLLGWGVQLGRARTSALREQAARLSREHAVSRERALQQEKSRIAREMHDVVAHHVSVITAQAAGAQRVFDARPELARQALADIEVTGRGALTEMRRVVGLLRPPPGEARLDPPPTLGQLPALVARTEHAGLPVRLSISGSPSELPPGMELNAFRILQEALTNTLMHADASRVDVDLDYGPENLTLRVSDDGRGLGGDAGSGGLGRGLIGMRERVALHGGELQVADRPEGGVQVLARLPLEVAGVQAATGSRHEGVLDAAVTP